MLETTTAVVKKKGVARLVEFIEQNEVNISNLSPVALNQGEVVSALLAAVTRTPKLQACTTRSVFHSIATCYSLGLKIRDKSAYLVPYGPECTLLIDYRGKRDLAVRAGAVRIMVPRLVRQKDDFRVNDINSERPFFHRPFVTSGESGALTATTEADQGLVVGGYVHTVLPDGTIFPHDFMPRWELDKIQDAARAKAKDTPWVKWLERMQRKSLMHRAFNDIPLDDRMLISQQVDEAAAIGQPAPQVIDVSFGDVGNEPLDPEIVPDAEDSDQGDMPKRRSKE